MRFRFHRGGLKESLETTVEVNTLADLVEHINKSLIFPIKADDIEFRRVDPPLSDFQVNMGHWQTYWVFCNGKPMGLSDGRF